ncbi:MAG: trypsin-like serine protease [Planctomycetota bacterium]
MKIHYGQSPVLADPKSWQNDTPPTDTLPAPAGQVLPESIIGPDNREQVSSSMNFPWRSICRLRMYFGSTPYIGTGFLIRQNLLLTAAHNLYKPAHGLSSKVIVLAGINGGVTPNFGTCEVGKSFLRVPPEYRAGDKRWDFGVVVLNRPFAAPPLALTKFNANFTAPGIVSGYPKKVHNSESLTQNGTTQWFHRGTISRSTGNLFYNIDTSKGQSGAPVLVERIPANGSPYWSAVGVHVRSSSNGSGNEATVINNVVLDRLKSWLPGGGGS